MELKLELISMLFAFMMCSTVNFCLVLGPLVGRLDMSRLDTSIPNRKLVVQPCRRGNSPAGWQSAPTLNPKMRRGLKRFACW
jgi:hypothetical protein